MGLGKGEPDKLKYQYDDADFDSGEWEFMAKIMRHNNAKLLIFKFYGIVNRNNGYF